MSGGAGCPASRHRASAGLQKGPQFLARSSGGRLPAQRQAEGVLRHCSGRPPDFPNQPRRRKSGRRRSPSLFVERRSDCGAVVVVAIAAGATSTFSVGESKVANNRVSAEFRFTHT